MPSDPSTDETVKATEGARSVDEIGSTVAAPDQTVDSVSGRSGTSSNEHTSNLPPVDPSLYVDRVEMTRGGMGRILSAHDRRLKRSIAIKELRVQTPELRARFEREALLTARLQHPSIVSIHEAGRWPSGEPFYAMKLVPGRPLDQVIAATLAFEERLALLPHVVAVADALAYAHGQRVIHRDLKPQNVLVGEFGETVVIDWGLAKDLGKAEVEMKPASIEVGAGLATVAGDVLGTPAYMPPEQAEGEPVDERADVYAIGALLYHVLSGRPPYAGKSAVAILDEVRRRPPAPLDAAVPPDLHAIVTRAMARDPNVRYASARLLAEDLHRYQAGQLVGAHRYSLRQLLRRWLRRHRTAVLVAVVAALALIGVGITSIRRIVEDERRVEAGFVGAARAQLANAQGLLRRDLLRLGNDVDRLAAAGDLLQALASSDTAVGEYLALQAPNLPSGLIEVFDVAQRRVASFVVGAELTQSENRSFGSSSSTLTRGSAYTRHAGFELTSDRMVARAVAPIVDAAFHLRGLVVVTRPLDDQYADQIKAAIHADVLLYPLSGPESSSFAAPGAGQPLDLPTPSKRSRANSVTREQVDGREYLVAYGNIVDDEQKVIGVLGIALPHGPEPALSPQQTLTIGSLHDAISLDPAAATDSPSSEVLGQVYDTLVRYRPGSADIEPALATSFEVSADGRAWTFHLRRGVRFHDGTPVDADAVVFSFERQRGPSHPAFRSDFQYWSTSFRTIVAIKKITADTVRFELERPFAPFLSNLATLQASIVSPSAVKRWGDEYGSHPVGTGPYRFESWNKDATRGREVVLRRNTEYWRASASGPTLDRLIFVEIKDSRQRQIALESGAIDIAVELLPEERQAVELHPDLTLHLSPSKNIAYLAMNMDERALRDREVRQAIAYAINKQAIVQLAFQGLAIPASSPIPPTQWGHHEASKRYAYDPERARALLSSARTRGVWDPDSTLRLYMSSTSRPYMPNPALVARSIQANLTSVGIHTELVLQPFTQSRADLRNGKHDLCVWGWIGENGDPDNFMQLLDSNNSDPGSALNVAFFRNAEVHGLITRAQEQLRDSERAPLYSRAQDIIAEEAPWVPLAHSQVAVAMRKNVTGLVFRFDDVIDFARLVKKP